MSLLWCRIMLPWLQCYTGHYQICIKAQCWPALSVKMWASHWTSPEEQDPQGSCHSTEHAWVQGVFGQPSQAHSHVNFGVSYIEPRQLPKPSASCSRSWSPQTDLTTGMLQWLMAQKIKSKHTLWGTLNIHPGKGGGCVSSLELLKYKDSLNSSLFVKTPGQPPAVMQLVPQDCACMHLRVNELCMKWGNTTEKSWYLQVFIKTRIKINSLLIVSITTFKLQQYFRNWLDICPEFSTLHCQYLFNLLVCDCITCNKQYEPLTEHSSILY